MSSAGRRESTVLLVLETGRYHRLNLTQTLTSMPTYSYKCRRCGRAFEKIQKMTDPPRARCPKCKGAGERLISGGAGLLFKGGGFYTTDYRSESYKQAAKADSGEATSKADSAEATAKADSGEATTKPATKTDKPEKTEKPTGPVKGAKGEARSGKRGHRAD